MTHLTEEAQSLVWRVRTFGTAVAYDLSTTSALVVHNHLKSVGVHTEVTVHNRVTTIGVLK